MQNKRTHTRNHALLIFPWFVLAVPLHHAARTPACIWALHLHLHAHLFESQGFARICCNVSPAMHPWNAQSDSRPKPAAGPLRWRCTSTALTPKVFLAQIHGRQHGRERNKHRERQPQPGQVVGEFSLWKPLLAWLDTSLHDAFPLCLTDWSGWLTCL